MLRRAFCFALILLSPPVESFAAPPLEAVSRWRADGDATDSVGDNDGVLENKAGFATGIDGQAFELDGTSQWVTVAVDANLVPGEGAFSASVWFNRSGPFQYSDQASPVLGMADGDFDNGWGLGSGGSLGPNPGCSVDDLGGDISSAVADFAVPVDTWAQMACVYDAAGNSLAFYVNGALEDSVAAAEGPVTPSADLYIGRYRRFSVSGRDEFFPGLIDDAQYFARVLTDDEVASVFLEHVPLTVGDVDCSGELSATDALKTLRHSVGSSVSQTQPCPRIAAPFAGVAWGDIDCAGTVTASDALKTLRAAVELDVAQEEPCADPGEPPL